MPHTLPPFLRSYIDSMNACDTEAFVTHFATEAIVQDEGHEHRGPTAIKAWIENAHRKYQPTMDVTGLTEHESETVITGLVSGTFEGSPLELAHHLILKEGRIVSLVIKA